ncbi:hypothetical protein [Parabacteroides sp. CH2-D42-20]|uniref:hypothetical protein n=1 Tax=Parabacteroides sp. CH2-D42-20 TaxID=2320086 RepID=UPI0011C43DF6|nr:hypothetical protein [Parabacteroides sp. CH2-D42-20]
MIDYLSVQAGKVLLWKPESSVSGKGKEKRVGNAGWKDNSLAWGILLLPIYRIRKKGTPRQCVVRVGEMLFVRLR